MDDARIRFRFAKLGDRRFLSHLDLLRVFERALRRAGASVRFSEGFHPRPRMSVPFALPLGVEAEREILEIRFAGAADPDGARTRLQGALPAGLEIREAVRVSSFRKPERIRARYRVEPRAESPPPIGRWREAVGGDGLRNGELLRDLGEEEGAVRLDVDVVDGRGLRPHDLLRALGTDPDRYRIVRTDLWWEEAPVPEAG